jgi:trans-aconitate methyltransferase
MGGFGIKIIPMNKIKASELTQKTLNHYSANPLGFWQGTKDHDVTQNINALLNNIQGSGPYTILDFGCGPGRDLKYFKDLGHEAHGLDGCPEFCEMARSYAKTKVFHQNFIDVNLAPDFYNGIFANASLFHVPKNELTKLLMTFHKSLKENGVLFSSNPRGQGEDLHGSRYANFMELEDYREIVETCGFKLIEHYYRPQNLPREQQPWLACVFIKNS